MASISPNKNQPYNVDVNTLANNSSNGNWTVTGGQIRHENNIGSYADYVDNSLVIGDTYRVTYTISNYSSCSFRVYLGDTPGTTRSANGTYTQVLVLTGSKRVRFYSNGFGTISHFKLEHLVTNLVEIPIDTQNTTLVENKSWTLSYNPILEQWTSFHSYLPNNYIIHPTGLLTKRNDTQLKLVNSGDYGIFFDEDIKPWIIESVFNDNKLYTKVFDNITVNLETMTQFNAPVNQFFEGLVLSNEFQCSGVISLDSTNLTKKEKNWMINKFTDLTSSNSSALFSTDWNSIKAQYPIDKVVNNSKINGNKPWYQRGRFRDKYLVARFIDNNFENTKFLLKFVISTYRISQR